MSTRTQQKIRVVVVDDSSFIRRALARMLDGEAHIEVVGTAASGEVLLASLADWAPDVITLDLEMPGMGGLATLDHIRDREPEAKVLILSTHSGAGAPQTIEALHRGAVDFIDKQQYSLVDFASLRAVLTTKIFQVCDLQPELPSPIDIFPGDDSSTEMPSLAGWLDPSSEPAAQKRFTLLAIGASTGGPPAIQRLLEDLGARVTVPILIVQHMPIGFTGAFAERLNAHLPLEVREAAHGERPVPGTVLIAPGGHHLRVRVDHQGLVLNLGSRPREALHTPSIDVLFRSVARTVGRRALGVLLTGMGSDGARGLGHIRDLGGHSVVQDEMTSVVYGMPRAALTLGVVDDVVAIEAMGTCLTRLLGQEDDGRSSKAGRWNGREKV